jgi:hypothetical protein
LRIKYLKIAMVVMLTRATRNGKLATGLRGRRIHRLLYESVPAPILKPIALRFIGIANPLMASYKIGQNSGSF